MHIRIAHTTTYTYERPLRSLTQLLRLSPRSDEGQHVRNWRVEVEPDFPLRRAEDAFGNLTDLLFVDAPLTSLSLSVTGEVDTTETAGVLAGAVERFAPSIYLRDTALTTCDAALASFADGVIAQKSEPTLARLHGLMHAVRERMAFEPGATRVSTSAAQAFALGRGVCQDLTHVFLVCARRFGAPARYVSGHLARADGVVEQEASHAWAEAWIEGLGWVGFDVTNGVAPGERHVRIATALDYLGAAPVRGARQGGGEEHLSVRLSVEPAYAGRRTQTQQQGRA